MCACVRAAISVEDVWWAYREKHAVVLRGVQTARSTFEPIKGPVTTNGSVMTRVRRRSIRAVIATVLPSSSCKDRHIFCAGQTYTPSLCSLVPPSEVMKYTSVLVFICHCSWSGVSVTISASVYVNMTPIECEFDAECTPRLREETNYPCSSSDRGGRPQRETGWATREVIYYDQRWGGPWPQCPSSGQNRVTKPPLMLHLTGNASDVVRPTGAVVFDDPRAGE